jgi:hypothetical protein
MMSVIGMKMMKACENGDFCVIDGPNEPVKWGGNGKNTKPTQFLFFPGEME